MINDKDNEKGLLEKLDVFDPNDGRTSRASAVPG